MKRKRISVVERALDVSLRGLIWRFGLNCATSKLRKWGAPWPTSPGVHIREDVVETLGRQLLCCGRRREVLGFHGRLTVPLAPMGLRLTRVGSGSQMGRQL